MAFTQNIEAMKLCQDNVAPVLSIVTKDKTLYLKNVFNNGIMIPNFGFI